MHYLTPLVTKGLNVPGSVRIVSQWEVGAAGLSHRAADVSYLPAVLPAAAGLGKGRWASSGIPLQCMVQHGFTF